VRLSRDRFRISRDRDAPRRRRRSAALAAAKARGAVLGNPRLAEARAIANAHHKAGADTFADTVAPAIREAALSRQTSIGDFRRRIRPSALVIREQKQ
jgi:hypothetical protein